MSFKQTINTPPSVKHLPHSLVRQLDAQKRRRVRRHRSRQRGPEAREEGLDAALAVELPDDAADAHVALGGLQPALHRVDGEHGDPHGDTGGAARDRDRGQAQVALGQTRDGVLGGESALDVLVGGEVGGAAGHVAGEGGGAAAEDGAHAAFLVELAHDVEAALVLGLLAGLQALALDLQDHLDALEGRGDDGHGHGAEGARRGDLADGEGRAGDGRRGGEGGDELLAQVEAPERYGDCICS